MVFWFIVENTMLPIFVLVLLGFFLDKKFGMNVKTLSKLMFYLIIPSFVFVNVYKMHPDANSVKVIFAIATIMFSAFCIAGIISWVRHYDIGRLQVCRNALMFNNSGNLGVALILLVFSHEPFMVNGETPYLAEAMSVQLLIYIFQNITVNTLGMYQAGRGKLSTGKTLKAVFSMPVLYMMSAALLGRFFHYDASKMFLWPVMEMSAKALLPVAMISIGAQLSQTKIHWLDKDVWIVSMMKLVGIPILGLLIIYGVNYLAPGTFTPVSSTVFLIYCAIPTAVNVALFSIEFDNHPDFATQVVMNTTALSAVTMTFFIFLGHVLFV